MSIPDHRDGIFLSAHSFKCRHCRRRDRRKPSGTPFIIYHGHGQGEPWISCLTCAGVYRELVPNLTGVDLPAGPC